MTGSSFDVSNLTQRGRPAVLLLGQRGRNLGLGADPLLAKAAAVFSAPGLDTKGISALLNLNHDRQPDLASWLSAQSMLAPLGDALEIVGKVPWSGVLTSDILPGTARGFRAPWRDLQNVFSVAAWPEAPTDRQRLHIYWLFGRLDEDEPDKRAPRQRSADLLTRRPFATALLARVPDAVTPRGTLCIEGVEPGSDWLRAEDDLYAPIARLAPGQAHWFSWPPARQVPDILQDLVASGRLTLHAESLAALIQQGLAAGVINLEEPLLEAVGSGVVALGGRHHRIPDRLAVRAAAFGHLVDTASVLPPSDMDPAMRYSAFRDFVRDPASSMDPWLGFKLGFVIRRDHDEQLLQAVQRSLDRLSRSRRQAVVLQGPAGSGRTVSLARAAFEFGRDKNLLAYFVRGRNQPPDDLLEDLARFAGNAEGRCLALFWDGDRLPTDYQRIVDALTGRGLNILVAGTSFPVSGKGMVAARGALSAKEYSDLRALLRREAGEVADRLPAHLAGDQPLLVLLYRILPETRSALSGSLNAEASDVVASLRRKVGGAQLGAAKASLGALAEALVRAGVTTAPSGEAPPAMPYGWERTPDDDLLATVMASGQFGVPVPLSLAIRSSRSGTREPDWLHFESSLRDVDLVRVAEDDRGDVLVLPRHPVEARILSRQVCGTTQEEVRIFERLIMGAEIDPGRATGESRFLVELLARIGPNARESAAVQRFRPHYGQIAYALKQRRGSKFNTEVALQEALLRRTHAKAIASNGGDDSEALELLRENVDLLRSAIALVSPDGRRRIHLKYLRVELIANQGSLAHQLATNQGWLGEAVALQRQVKSTALTLAGLDPSFYYPLDVLLWTTHDVYRGLEPDHPNRVLLATDLRQTITEIDTDLLPGDQAEKFERRLQKLRHTLDDITLRRAETLRWATANPAAYARLEALAVSDGLLRKEHLEQGDAARLGEAVRILEAQGDSGQLDLDGQRLLFRLTWQQSTGRPFLVGERGPTPPMSSVARLRSLADALVRASGDVPSLRHLFALAVLSWCAGDYPAARSAWDQLQSESDFGSQDRIRKLLLLTGEGQHSITFEGRVESVQPDGRRGRVRIDGLGQSVPVSIQDFRIARLVRDQRLGPFYLAFNFLGPVAVPAGD